MYNVNSQYCAKIPSLYYFSLFSKNYTRIQEGNKVLSVISGKNCNAAT